MKKPTARMSISRKIFLIASSFALPIVVLMYLMVVNINSNIDFAAQEIRCNATSDTFNAEHLKTVMNFVVAATSLYVTDPAKREEMIGNIKKLL